LVVAAGQPVAPPPFGGGEPPDREALLEAPVRWPRSEPFDGPLSTLSGVGPKLEALAAEAGVETVFDLLWRVPGGYSESPDRRRLCDLETGVPGSVSVEIVSSRRVRVRRRGLSVVEAMVADESGSLKAVWFNRHWVLDELKPGRSLILEGRLEKKGFVVSDHQLIDGRPAGDASPPGLDDGAPRPRHSAGGDLGPARWRRWAWQACRLAGDLADPLPSALLGRRGMPTAATAIREAHFPNGVEGSEIAKERLAYEELFLHQVVLSGLRSQGRLHREEGAAIDGDKARSAAWLEKLPFELTGEQQAALRDIDLDLSQPEPMHRLLMGEVGSGKTVVALWAMLRAVESGRQAALMAPTEVLVDQHASTIARLLRGTGVKLGVLTGSSTPAQRREVLASLANGEPSIVIGTQALLEDPIVFGALALCVIDEEHRFGVRQRDRLDRKAPSGERAHVLHLSATPIPRTLSLTSYGDLEITSIRELPCGRLPVATELVSESDRTAVFERVKAEVRKGRQAFVVCPLVEESQSIEARAAEVEAELLREGELSDCEVGLIHGRMSSERKEVAMKAFEAGRTDVLVATTVIEVGIDVPNATMIMIEGAERFGLSQLHQLRGRVGRGVHRGCCLLMSSSGSPAAHRRLSALAGESDGFRLAEIDLEMRGEGEVTGTRQHGLPRFRVARLPRDGGLLEAAREDLVRMLDEYGGLDAPAFGPMTEVARRRFDRTGAIR
jgi:ATP-dependent DNA helicase RecG